LAVKLVDRKGRIGYCNAKNWVSCREHDVRKGWHLAPASLGNNIETFTELTTSVGTKTVDMNATPETHGSLQIFTSTTEYYSIVNPINRSHPLLTPLQQHLGKPFHSLIPSHMVASLPHASKGMLGNLLQEHLYRIPANSNPEADFTEHNIELKVTPVVERKGVWVPKERLVAGIINYHEYSTHVPLFDTHFWQKNQTILFVFYQPHTTTLQSTIIDGFVYDLKHSPLLAQIEEDYNLIVNKIVKGEAHKISGGDTKFLEAATKGAGQGKDMRTQPNSDILAKQRAFAFKPNLMRTITQHIKTNLPENR
jgi:DNA mismatch repair protein MutH